MSNNKTATLTFRIDPTLKAALKFAAQREHRSLANMVEVLIRDYCLKNDIPLSLEALNKLVAEAVDG